MENAQSWENRNICVAAGVWGSPQKCVVDIQTLCLQNHLPAGWVPLGPFSFPAGGKKKAGKKVNHAMIHFFWKAAVLVNLIKIHNCLVQSDSES